MEVETSPDFTVEAFTAAPACFMMEAAGFTRADLEGFTAEDLAALADFATVLDDLAEALADFAIVRSLVDMAAILGSGTGSVLTWASGRIGAIRTGMDTARGTALTRTTLLTIPMTRTIPTIAATRGIIATVVTVAILATTVIQTPANRSATVRPSLRT